MKPRAVCDSLCGSCKPHPLPQSKSFCLSLLCVDLTGMRHHAQPWDSFALMKAHEYGLGGRKASFSPPPSSDYLSVSPHIELQMGCHTFAQDHFLRVNFGCVLLPHTHIVSQGSWDTRLSPQQVSPSDGIATVTRILGGNRAMGRASECLCMTG